MKRLILLGLCSISISLHAQDELVDKALPTITPPNNKPIRIDSPVINLVNGTSFIDIEGIINFRLIIRHLDLGDQKKQCLYQGNYYSIRELATLEDDPSADKQALKKTLHDTITLFEKYSDPYIQDAQAGKQFSMKIIARWMEQRNRPNSHLGEWSRNSAADERVLFRKEIVTFKKFDEFCDDLTLFLLDLVYSCDISYKKYREKKAAAHAANANKSESTDTTA